MFIAGPPRYARVPLGSSASREQDCVRWRRISVKSRGSSPPWLTQSQPRAAPPLIIMALEGDVGTPARPWQRAANTPPPRRSPRFAAPVENNGAEAPDSPPRAPVVAAENLATADLAENGAVEAADEPANVMVTPPHPTVMPAQEPVNATARPSAFPAFSEPSRVQYHLSFFPRRRVRSSFTPASDASFTLRSGRPRSQEEKGTPQRVE